MPDALYTIGHSTHSLTDLVGLLRPQSVTALCDVRSTPYSRFNPQYNREELKDFLATHGITYVFLGKELGARSEDPACYVGRTVQFDRLARTELFQSGLGRVQEGMKHFRLVLLCAEKEPLECHRTILVSRYLVERGVDVEHIHADGRTETHPDALLRLTDMLNLREAEGHMFRTREALFEDAYRLQEKRIAYSAVREESSPARSEAR